MTTTTVVGMHREQDQLTRRVLQKIGVTGRGNRTGSDHDVIGGSDPDLMPIGGRQEDGTFPQPSSFIDVWDEAFVRRQARSCGPTGNLDEPYISRIPEIGTTNKVSAHTLILAGGHGRPRLECGLCEWWSLAQE